MNGSEDDPIENWKLTEVLVALSHDCDDAWDELLRRDRLATELKAKLNTLEAEALDTQRNEERAAAEIAEVEMKLNTLEAAVRAVRDDEHIEWYHNLHPDQALSKLYALVPESTS